MELKLCDTDAIYIFGCLKKHAHHEVTSRFETQLKEYFSNTPIQIDLMSMINSFEDGQNGHSPGRLF